MSTPQREDRDPERTSWLRTLYQVSHSDIRWAKEQGWRIVNWTLLLFSALLGLAKYLHPQISPITFAYVDAVIVIVAIVYLAELHIWAAGTRRTAAKIEDEIADVTTILERRSHDRNHLFYLGVQLLVVVGACILVVTAHIYLACTSIAT